MDIPTERYPIAQARPPAGMPPAHLAPLTQPHGIPPLRPPPRRGARHTQVRGLSPLPPTAAHRIPMVRRRPVARAHGGEILRPLVFGVFPAGRMGWELTHGGRLGRVGA